MSEPQLQGVYEFIRFRLDANGYAKCFTCNYCAPIPEMELWTRDRQAKALKQPSMTEEITTPSVKDVNGSKAVSRPSTKKKSRRDNGSGHGIWSWLKVSQAQTGGEKEIEQMDKVLPGNWLKNLKNWRDYDNHFKTRRDTDNGTSSLGDWKHGMNWCSRAAGIKGWWQATYLIKKEAGLFGASGRTQLIKWIKSGRYPRTLFTGKLRPILFKHELRQCVWLQRLEFLFPQYDRPWFLPNIGRREKQGNQPIGENPCPFKESPHWRFLTCQKCIWSSQQYPLTSIRRAMTDLTKAGDLVKTENKRKGLFNEVNYTWNTQLTEKNKFTT